MRVIALLTLALLLSASAGAAPACNPSDAAFDVVFESNASPVSLGSASAGSFGDRAFVIRDELEWCELWRQAHANLSPQPPCDTSAVDFRHDVVIGATGTRPDSCRGPRIERIEQAGRALRVYVTGLVGGCGCFQIVSYPTEAVAISKPVGSVVFVHDTVGVGCIPEAGFGPEPPITEPPIILFPSP